MSIGSTHDAPVLAIFVSIPASNLFSGERA
jgi:hypothetical protein